MARVNVFEEIRKSTLRFANVFAAGRARHAALAAYESQSDLLAALDMSSPLTMEVRGALVGALVQEQQRAAHALWQGLLVCAFEPMLRGLRARLGRKSDEDKDQAVLLAFLEAVKSLPITGTMAYAPIALRRATEHAVFAEVTAQQSQPRMLALKEKHRAADVFASDAPRRMADSAAAEVARIVGKGGDGGELLKVVLATCIGDEPLTEYVARNHPALSTKERAVVYRRLYSDRLRVLAGLRARLSSHRSAA